MNLLLTSVGRRSYLVEYFKQALDGTGEVCVCNSTALSPAFPCADHGAVAPLVYSREYIPFLLDYCQTHRIDALISLLDLDLPVLAAHRRSFEAIGVRLVVSSPQVVATCNDKWRTYLFLQEHGFDAPATWLEPADIQARDARFPLVIKPRWGMASLCMHEVADRAELDELFQKAQRDTLRSAMLGFEAGQDSGHCVLLQEKLVGQEYGLDVINDLDGVYQATIVKRKLGMRAGETDCAKTEDNPMLESLGRRLSQELGHIANLDVDVFVSDGRPYVLEMNARFGGGYPFSHLAGVDLPRAIVAWLDGKGVDASLLKARPNVIGHKDLLIRDITESVAGGGNSSLTHKGGLGPHAARARHALRGEGRCAA